MCIMYVNICTHVYVHLPTDKGVKSWDGLSTQVWPAPAIMPSHYDDGLLGLPMVALCGREIFLNFLWFHHLVGIDGIDFFGADQGHGRVSAKFMGFWTATCQPGMGGHLPPLPHPSSCSQRRSRELGGKSEGHHLATESHFVYATLRPAMQLPGSTDCLFLLERRSCRCSAGLCWRIQLSDWRSRSMCWGLEISAPFCGARDAVHPDGVSSFAGGWRGP